VHFLARRAAQRDARAIRLVQPVARGETAELPLAVLKEHIGDADFFGTTSRRGWKTFVGCTAGYSERADANQGLKAPHK
jgi:hypothetical protein